MKTWKCLKLFWHIFVLWYATMRIPEWMLARAMKWKILLKKIYYRSSLISLWHIGQAEYTLSGWRAVMVICLESSHQLWHDLSRIRESVDDAAPKYIESRPWHACPTGCISIHTTVTTALNNESLYSKLIQTVQNALRLRTAITDYERTDFLINRIQIIDAQHQMATTRQQIGSLCARTVGHSMQDINSSYESASESLFNFPMWLYSVRGMTGHFEVIIAIE